MTRPRKPRHLHQLGLQQQSIKLGDLNIRNVFLILLKAKKSKIQEVADSDPSPSKS